MKPKILISLDGALAPIEMDLRDVGQPERHQACVDVAANALIHGFGAPAPLKAHQEAVALFVEGVFDGESPRALRVRWDMSYVTDDHLEYLGQLMCALHYAPKTPQDTPNKD